MSTVNDRVDDLLGRRRDNRRVLVTPEGVPLDLAVAGCGERLAAFGIDFGILIGCLLAAALLLGFMDVGSEGEAAVKTLLMFFVFLLRTFYFLFFELAWQGRTPGKKACGLRVVNRSGGELAPGAVVARNLIREAEFFLPLSLLLSLDGDAGMGWQLSLAGWAILFGSLPLWNRDRLRAGDVIAGTLVIAMPKRELSRDLAAKAPFALKKTAYSFTRDQLSKYGAFELQVLEEVLRRPYSEKNERLLEDIRRKVAAKIGWDEPLRRDEAKPFLTAFYAAERAELERDKLFGRMREDKHSRPRRKD